MSASLPSAPLPTRRAILRGGLAVAAAALPSRRGAAQELRFFQIGTGTTGGTYFQIGGLLANAISSPPGAPPCDRGGSCGVPGLIAVAQATSGAVENVLSLRQVRMESALVQADIAYAAYRAEGPFRGAPPAGGLRAIANLYVETIHLVVRADSGIRSIADLKSKRVGIGEQGSGTLVSARQILSVHGLSEDAIQPSFISPGRGADRLAAGDLDAFFIIGGSPLPSVADLAQRVRIALLPLNDKAMEELARRLPFFAPQTISSDMYPGVAETPTLGVRAQWITRADLPDPLIQTITQALWNKQTRALLDAGHPQGAAIRIETALAGLAVPLHTGAERYYRDAGLIKEEALPSVAPTVATGGADASGPRRVDAPPNR